MKKINKAEYTCNMCGDKFYSSFTNTSDFEEYQNAIPCSKDKNAEFEYDWVFEFKIPEPGYGSFIDSVRLEKIHICDDCLHALHEGLEIKPEVIHY